MQTKILAALCATTAAFIALPAAAQVDGVASANVVIAIGSSKAFIAAQNQINTANKAALDQIDAKMATKQTLLAQLDKNGDKNVDDAELAAAEAAKNPALGQVGQIDKDVAVLYQPTLLATAYSLEQVTQKYDAAQSTVVAARKITVILSPEAFVYAPPAADVTAAITAELDRTLPTVSTTAPAGWQPQRSTMQILQQIRQLQQLAAQRAAAQGGAGAGGAPRPAPAPAPAGGKPKPTGR